MDERELPAGSPDVPDHPQSGQDITQGPAPTVDAAFSAFYRQFTPTLVAFLIWQRARLPDAADLAQETMSEAYRCWSKIREPKAWARQVASRKLARLIAGVEDPTDPMPEHSSLLRSLTDVTAWEQQHEVLRMLDRLPSRQRQVMAWTLEEYTPAEIAEELKITGEAVRASLMKARKALAQDLGTTGDER